MKEIAKIFIKLLLIFVIHLFKYSNSKLDTQFVFIEVVKAASGGSAT